MPVARRSSMECAPKVRFAPDSSLEGGGFEPSVRGAKEPVSVKGELWGLEQGQPKKVVSLWVRNPRSGSAE